MRVIDASPLPDAVSDERMRAQLTFVAEADKLKVTLRSSMLAASNRNENSAEHSWHLALMVLTLAEYAAEPIDIGHTIKLVTVHDLVEVYAGDTPVYDSIARLEQVDREQTAAARIFGLLPTGQSDSLRRYWTEFEAGATPEARFAKAMDRLQPLLLNWLRHGGTWRTPGVTEADVRRLEVDAIAHAPRLKDLAESLVAEGRHRGWIRREPLNEGEISEKVVPGLPTAAPKG